MSFIAPVENGKIVETESQNSLKNTSSTSTSGMDKESFLQLLVAQMKYQDPLEPTSNTEYISQYAQFSQVEQMQNMAATSELSRASSLVGKQVYVKTTMTTGETKYIQGKVDYVVFENGKPYLSINEALYSLDDLDTVADEEYLEAYNLAYDFVVGLNKLPSVKAVDESDIEAIQKLQEVYEGMNDYQKSFIASDKVKDYKEYVARMEELVKEMQKPSEEENTGDTNKTEGEDGDETAK